MHEHLSSHCNYKKEGKKTQKVFGISHRLEKKNTSKDELFYNLKIL